MATAKAPPWPSELRFQKDRAELLIRFDDGVELSIPYELLRVESPSAETKGHGGDRPPPPVKKRKVGVLGAEREPHLPEPGVVVPGEPGNQRRRPGQETGDGELAGP